MHDIVDNHRRLFYASFYSPFRRAARARFRPFASFRLRRRSAKRSLRHRSAHGGRRFRGGRPVFRRDRIRPLRMSRMSLPPSLSAKTESIPPPKMLRSICISTAVCRRILSPKRTPALSAGAAAVWMTAPTANASAETGLETMKDGCRTRRDANTASATSIRCTPPPAGRSASYTPTTGSSIIPRTTMRALYCFMAKNDAF